MALEAVLRDLRSSAPDLILHGGDLADNGSSPAETIDRVRDLGWQGVGGNTDEMLANPASLEEFAAGKPHLTSLFTALGRMADWTRAALGEERLAWLQALPKKQIHDPVALVHATAESRWRAPADSAGDEELRATFAPLGQPITVYGHIHLPYIRRLGGPTITNAGSVGLPYDGDSRASYLLINDGEPQVRRVAYELDRELQRVRSCGLPHAEWVARTLVSARPELP